MPKRIAITILALFLIVVSAQAMTAGESQGITVFPNDSIWYTRVDNLSVHPQSSNWINALNWGLGETTPAWTSPATVAGPGRLFLEWKYPINVVDNAHSTQTTIGVTSYGKDSDYCLPGVAGGAGHPCTTIGSLLYSVPTGTSYGESCSNPEYDCHKLVLNTNTKRLYEFYGAYTITAPRQASQYDLTSYKLRGKYPGTTNVEMDGNEWALPRTSATGLSGVALTPLLPTPGELQAGEIKHAMYAFAPWTLGNSGGVPGYYGESGGSFIWPVRGAYTLDCGATGTHNGFACPPNGARIRLKDSFDVSGYSKNAQVLLNAVKKYGIIIGDHANPRWSGYQTDKGTIHILIGGSVYHNGVEYTDGDEWGTVATEILITKPIAITTTNFEFVNESSLMVSPNSMQSKQSGTIPPDDPHTDPIYVDPYVGYLPTNLSGTAPLTVAFTDLSFDNPDNATFWEWSFNNVTGNNTWTGFGYDENPSYTFTEQGNYSINLTVGNLYGYNTTPFSAWVNVSPNTVTPPLAQIGIPSPLTGDAPLTVYFTDGSWHTPTSWLWQFGDGYTSTDQDPMHVYNTSGTFIPYLTATNAGGSDTTSYPAGIIVTAPTPPIAAMSVPNPQSGTIPLTVTFQDWSTNTPTSWLWDFGDGSTSTTQNPTHIYTVAGLYSITLTVTNGGGSDSVTRPNAVYATDPVTITPTATWTPVPTLTAPPTSGPGSHPRAMAVTPIPTIQNDHYLPILGMLAMGDEQTTAVPNWSAMPLELMGVYTDYMGPIAFLIVFLIPFGMMWLAHGNMKLLGILGMIVGGFVFLYLPANYVAAAVMAIAIGFAALLWGLFKQ